MVRIKNIKIAENKYQKYAFLADGRVRKLGSPKKQRTKKK